MELLLNLAWLLLALPAYWLWRGAAGTRLGRRFSALQGLLALGCALVLLFPVISASDDLHAMRAEMEDSSSTNKRTVRQAGGDKNSGWTRLQGPAAILTSATAWVAPGVERVDVSVLSVSPLMMQGVFYGGRAPPFSFLV